MVEQKNLFSPVGFLVFFILIFAAACATLETSDKKGPPPPEPVNLAHPFTDIPVPGGYDLDRSRSFVYESGSGAIKVGRLFFTGWDNMEVSFAFYQNEMANNGWTLVNSMEHKGKILHYEKEGWVCTVIINPAFMGSDIEVQVGPK